MVDLAVVVWCGVESKSDEISNNYDVTQFKYSNNQQHITIVVAIATAIVAAIVAAIAIDTNV